MSTSEQETPAPEGIRVAAVTAWVDANIAGRSGRLRFTKLAGGHSNFTYLVEPAHGAPFVLRRPPMGELLPSAHDMGREFRIISALWPTAVPVPEPLAFCADTQVTGAAFYGMGVIDGKAFYEGADVRSQVPEENRRALGFSFIDVLAALHDVDPDEAGLGELGKKTDYVARQLHRWHASWKASVSPDVAGVTEVDRIHDALVARLPEQGPARVVHGDYGLHNCLSATAGHVAAVVDWEISTLGDPLADLAYALNSWTDPDDEDPTRDEPPTLEPGFPRRMELADRYAAGTGRDLSNLAYYRAFNHWKTTCIIQGVYARYLGGQKSTEGIDLEGLVRRRDRSLELAAEMLAES